MRTIKLLTLVCVIAVFTQTVYGAAAPAQALPSSVTIVAESSYIFNSSISYTNPSQIRKILGLLPGRENRAPYPTEGPTGGIAFHIKYTLNGTEYDWVFYGENAWQASTGRRVNYKTNEDTFHLLYCLSDYSTYSYYGEGTLADHPIYYKGEKITELYVIDSETLLCRLIREFQNAESIADNIESHNLQPVSTYPQSGVVIFAGGNRYIFDLADLPANDSTIPKILDTYDTAYYGRTPETLSYFNAPSVQSITVQATGGKGLGIVPVSARDHAIAYTITDRDSVEKTIRLLKYVEAFPGTKTGKIQDDTWTRACIRLQIRFKSGAEYEVFVKGNTMYISPYRTKNTYARYTLDETIVKSMRDYLEIMSYS